MNASSFPVSDECETSPSLSEVTRLQAQQLVSNGVDSVSAPSDDAEREAAILHEGREMEAAMARYVESGCFTDRADADLARRRMEALIRGRSPQQVARMEQERGLA